MKIGSGLNMNVSNQGLVQQTQNLTGPEKFRQALAGVTSTLAAAAGAAAPFLPGGAVLSAAMSGFAGTAQQAIRSGGGVGAFGGVGASGASGGGGSYGVSNLASGIPGMTGGAMSGGVGGGIPGLSGGSPMDSLSGNATGTLGNPEAQLQQGFAQQMYMMQIQQQAQQSSEQFTTLSNLMNVRHQTAMTAINNIH